MTGWGKRGKKKMSKKGKAFAHEISFQIENTPGKLCCFHNTILKSSKTKIPNYIVNEIILKKLFRLYTTLVIMSV